MILPTDIDIDKLHYAIEHPNSTERGIGKTASILHKLMGEVQLGSPSNTYIIVTYHHNLCRMLAAEFVDMLILDGFDARVFNKITVIVDHTLTNRQLFKFVSKSTDVHSLLGHRTDRIFVDLLEHELTDQERENLHRIMVLQK